MNASIAYRLVNVAHSHFSQLMVNAFVFVCMVVCVSVYVGGREIFECQISTLIIMFRFFSFFYEQINIAEKNIFQLYSPTHMADMATGAFLFESLTF